jgi:hypothetical protein
MRRSILAVVAAAMLSAAPGAFAAPTCQRLDGLTARCGTPGAMPVGWVPSAQQALAWRLSRPPEDLTLEVVGTIGLLGALAALIALMPNFDGWKPGDWDRQEDDSQRPLR